VSLANHVFAVVADYLSYAIYAIAACV